ncbi:hypothetical protein KIN20_005624 [Parelaphostrongylus tenuis]|uniref:Uncharacterized protein n=1 Tax=Parelaphostrongylus tenuis TaxID=148309 RepID=A0AAD5MJ09_PARTN|nr:hypothetical protein KIN20_005624 [Parelaphostrongylus tenuis]
MNTNDRQVIYQNEKLVDSCVKGLSLLSRHTALFYGRNSHLIVDYPAVYQLSILKKSGNSRKRKSLRANSTPNGTFSIKLGTRIDELK